MPRGLCDVGSDCRLVAAAGAVAVDNGAVSDGVDGGVRPNVVTGAFRPEPWPLPCETGRGGVEPAAPVVPQSVATIVPVPR